MYFFILNFCLVGRICFHFLFGKIILKISIFISKLQNNVVMG